MTLSELNPKEQEVAKKVIKYVFDGQLEFAATELRDRYEFEDDVCIPGRLNEYLCQVLDEDYENLLDKVYKF